MVKYPETNILISPLNGLNSEVRKRLSEIQTYLEINGTNYSQSSNNIDRPTRDKSHYFMGNSVVEITTFTNKVNIKIIARDDGLLLGMKRSIEKLLE
jgi:hypothetical protein